MTICIAAIGNNDAKEVIAFATDHMITHPMGQFEKAMDKYKQIDNCTVAMLSGNPLVFNDLIEDCSKKKKFSNIKKAIQQNMKKLRSKDIKEQIYDIYGIDEDFIKDVLRGSIDNRYIGSALDAISSYTINCRILLIGFEDDEAQIAEIAENGISDMREINFGAIGSGAIQAINTLLFQGYSKDDKFSTTVYNVYKAKRNAEVSSGVGKKTDIMILSQSGVRTMHTEGLQILAKIYEEELDYGKRHAKLNEAIGSLNE